MSLRETERLGHTERLHILILCSVKLQASGKANRPNNSIPRFKEILAALSIHGHQSIRLVKPAPSRLPSTLAQAYQITNYTSDASLDSGNTS